MIEVEIKLAVTDSVDVRTKLLQLGFVENRNCLLYTSDAADD